MVDRFREVLLYKLNLYSLREKVKGGIGGRYNYLGVNASM